MLVLSRKTNESIVIGEDITLTVVEIRGDKVRLGIVAPKEVPIHRGEVYNAIHGREVTVPAGSAAASNAAREKSVPLGAAGRLRRAFPAAGPALSRFLADIVEISEPKDRLAAIDQILILLPKVRADLAGPTPDELATSSLPPNPFKEELMKHAGQWIAWTRDRTRILAVADSFAEVMAKAKVAGESDPYVKKAPGVSPTPAPGLFGLRDDESADIFEDIGRVIPLPDVWLDSPNDLLGGETPRDLISTGREQEVRYILRGIEDGITT